MTQISQFMVGGCRYSKYPIFEEDYPDAKTIFLEQNYRSTKIILTAANEVIKHNSERKPKGLWTANTGGEKLNIMKQ